MLVRKRATRVVRKIISKILRFNSALFRKGSKYFLRQMASKRVCALIADGSEELELISFVNPLRRAGNNVTIASAMPTKMV